MLWWLCFCFCFLMLDGMHSMNCDGILNHITHCKPPCIIHNSIARHDMLSIKFHFVVYCLRVNWSERVNFSLCDWLNTECRVVRKVPDDLIDFEWVLPSENRLQRFIVSQLASFSLLRSNEKLSLSLMFQYDQFI